MGKIMDMPFWIALSVAILSFQTMAADMEKAQASTVSVSGRQDTNITRNLQLLRKDVISGDLKFDQATGNASFKFQKASSESKATCPMSIKTDILTAYGFSFKYKLPSSSMNLKISIKNKQGGSYTWQMFPLAACGEFKEFKDKIETDADTSEIILDFELTSTGTAEICELRIESVGNARLKPALGKDGFRKLSEQEAKTVIASSLYIAEETEFAGREKKIQDSSAANGFCTSIAPNSPPYFNVSWNLESSLKSGKVFPGLPYSLYVTVKTDRKGDGGTAFRTGVYSNNDRRYVVADNRPPVKDIENKKWETYLIGSFAAESGQIGYVGPTSNSQNIGGIFVDRFIVAPGSAVTESLYEKINKNPGSIVFSCTPFNDAWFSMTVEVMPELAISYVSSEYPKDIPDSFQGIVVEYLNGGNVRKAIAFQLGDCGKSFSEPGRVRVKLSEEYSIDAELLVLPESKKRGVLNNIAIPVGKNAPAECKSARISLISVGSGTYLNGIFTSPSVNDMNISDLKTGKNMGIGKESLGLIQDKMSTKGIRSLKDRILK